MSIEVITGGLLTTIQDAGRHAYAAFGVAACGAADAHSHAIANLLVHNEPATATLEITLRGPTLRIGQAASIAITGAQIDGDIDGVAVPTWRRVDVPAGGTLRLGNCRLGARAYLAISGGIATPLIMGSRSTDLRGGFGGIDGRALREGDVLPLSIADTATIDQLSVAKRWVNPLPDLDLQHPAMLRFLRGSDALDADQSLEQRPWRVDARSNRQGVRLQGQPLAPKHTHERISEPVMPGTIQLPPDGCPTILGADAQTVGGYPRIGHVIRADWPRLAQLRAGDLVALQCVDHAQAGAAWRAQQARLTRIALALGAFAQR